jgi:flagellar protein FlgJ
MTVSGLGHAIGKVERPPANATAEQKLRGTAEQLQGVFVEQLFRAMRETVPTDGAFSGGQGEEIFRGLMDQHVAEVAPTQWHGPNSLGEILTRQLSRSLPEAPVHPAPVQEK